MRSLRRVIVAALALSAATAGAAPPDPAGKPTPAPVGAVAPLDRVLAFVDGTPIWWSTLSERMASQQLPDGEEARQKLADGVIEQMIDDALVLHRAEAMHIEVTDEEVNAAIEEIQVQNKLDKAGLEAALAAVGYTLPHYREDLRRQVMVLRAFSQTVPTSSSPDPELREKKRQAWVADLRRAARIERK